MMRQVRFTFALAICWGLSLLATFAQSNPTPYNLASGNYTLNEFNATTTNPYPELAFHVTDIGDPFLSRETTGDYAGTYNAGSGNRINSLGVNGFSFLNTSGGTLGAAVLAVNTSGRSNIQVTWTGETEATGTRDYRIRLQYRVGTSGAFTDVLNSGNPVEYTATATVGNPLTFGPVTLPVAVENQSVVQLRWKYYYASGSGARPRLSVDDISVTSTPSAGSPTKLAVTEIKPTSPTNTAPFSVTVTAQDALNSPKNVTLATNITLSLSAGTGTLGGTLTGTIPAGQSQFTFTNVTYNTIENGVQITATRTSGDALTAGISAPFNVQQGATQLAFVNFPSTGWTNFRIANFTVEARKPDGTLDTTYTGPVTLTQASGTGLQGNLTRNAFRGVAIFNDTANVSFANAGTFSIQASSGNLTSTTSSNITITQTPLLSDVIIPQYIKSAGSGNRVPSFALVRLDSLQPNTTYRYFAGASGPTTSSASIGGGNNMHYDATTGTYVYSTLRQLNATGGYSTFKTGANQRSMELWLNLTPTTNSAFNTGNDIRWIVSLGDSTGVQIARYLTAGSSKSIDFGTTATTATGIADRMSMLTPKNFVALYDNTAGTGSPISTAIVQEDGVEIGASALYYAELDGMPTSWATIIPNTLPNGVRRIEERTWNGSLVTVRTDADGIWNGISTVNPSTGLNAIYLETPFIALLYPDTTNVCSTAPLDLRYYAQGVDSVSIQVSRDSGRTYQEIGRRSAMDSTFSVPTALQVAGSQYSFRVIATQDGTIGDTSGVFAVSTPVSIVSQPQSVNACEGNQVILDVISNGTGLTYQWQKDGVNIPGATGARLIIPGIQQNNAGAYRVIVSGTSPCPSVVSNDAIVFVSRPTRIVQQPENAKTLVGGTVTLTAGFEITEPVTYQWRRGNQILTDNAKYSGTTSSVLEIRNVQQTEVDETYTVTATGLCGSATSNAARVSIVNFLINNITKQTPACLGNSVTLVADVSSTPSDLSLTYQWYFGSTALSESAKHSGTKTKNLNINNLNQVDIGEYKLIAYEGETNSTDTSTHRINGLGTAPSFVSIPSTIAICAGDSLTANFELNAGGFYNYTLLLNGSVVRVDSFSIALKNFTLRQANGVAGIYKLILQNGCGVDTSDAFTVIINENTAITQQPSNQVNISHGVTLNLTVQATGTGILTYQWFKDGVEIPGATSATYTKASATQADNGTYTVRVTGECGSVTSTGSTVFVGPNSVEGYTGMPGLKLEQNVPNPFSNETSVSFTIPEMTNVMLVVRDVLGRTVQTINLGMMTPGEHTSSINATDIPIGTYYYTLQTDNANITRRFLIVR